ncbi:MAG TPA: 30S ribosomal protein S10 [Candidatus Paceibacterota bacterium]
MAATAAKKAAPKRAATKKASAAAPAIGKLRIKVSAYEHKVLDMSVRQIVDTAIRYDGEVHGPIPLPTEIKKYTVNRGAFIDKNSREQFEMRVHKRMLDIVNPSAKIIEALTNIELPSGVGIDLKML